MQLVRLRPLPPAAAAFRGARGGVARAGTTVSAIPVEISFPHRVWIVRTIVGKLCLEKGVWCKGLTPVGEPEALPLLVLCIHRTPEKQKGHSPLRVPNSWNGH